MCPCSAVHYVHGVSTGLGAPLQFHVSDLMRVHIGHTEVSSLGNIEPLLQPGVEGLIYKSPLLSVYHRGACSTVFLDLLPSCAAHAPCSPDVVVVLSHAHAGR